HSFPTRRSSDLFAVVPTVTSAYANWDREDRAEDLRRLERGELVLEEGHETPASTVRDADLDEILEMPSESPWPIVLAACVAGIFAMLLVSHWLLAGAAALLAALSLVGWHSEEPAEA